MQLKLNNWFPVESSVLKEKNKFGIKHYVHKRIFDVDGIKPQTRIAFPWFKTASPYNLNLTKDKSLIIESPTIKLFLG